MTTAANIPRPALRYRGGKWRLGRRIVEMFPTHTCYVEPFAGGASVLLRKPPADFEIINDLDGDVVAFWRMLRTRPADLERAIGLTPYSREEFEASKDPGDADLERARRLYVRCYQGRASSTGEGGWRSQRSWNQSRFNTPWYFKELGHFAEIAERLSRVQVESRPAEDVIRAYDTPDTLQYLDPPYQPGKRRRRLYRLEMSDEEHERLSEVVHGLASMVVLSGYRSELYDRLYADWSRHDLVHRGEKMKLTTECLWLNPAAQERLERDSRQQELPTEAS